MDKEIMAGIWMRHEAAKDDCKQMLEAISQMQDDLTASNAQNLEALKQLRAALPYRAGCKCCKHDQNGTCGLPKPKTAACAMGTEDYWVWAGLDHDAPAPKRRRAPRRNAQEDTQE